MEALYKEAYYKEVFSEGGLFGDTPFRSYSYHGQNKYLIWVLHVPLHKLLLHKSYYTKVSFILPELTVYLISDPKALNSTTNQNPYFPLFYAIKSDMFSTISIN